ncbi:MAG: DUF2813 domain-containing protein [Proteobacteria bacterium]|uniref:DUF2813 domain-containing protein n=1 Tax=Candidatus Avisuccinivibrio stercorigallinarum TaxID=2840704 RepID=A0A9D9DDM8_9GAMM|nr:DUF2813 domain-containing protein [Candidatus Avisuccinivibrio stercorigallinarum]
MYLESCEIRNFRGLRHLKVEFEQGSTVMIGENAWGKSSLLSALYLMLGQGKIPVFEQADLYVPIEMHLKGSKQEERSSRALERSRRGRRSEHKDSANGNGRPDKEDKKADKKSGKNGSAKTHREHAAEQQEPKESSEPKERPAIDFTAPVPDDIANKAERAGSAVSALAADASPSETACRCGFEDEPEESEESLNEMLSAPIRRLFMEDYEFVKADVFKAEAKYLAIDLIFCEPAPGIVARSRRLQKLNPAWDQYSDGLQRIHWQVLAHVRNGTFITEHFLLDRRGDVIECSAEALLKQIIQMNPVLRVRDSRTLPEGITKPSADANEAEQELYEFSRKLAELSEDHDLNSRELVDGLTALNELAGRYLSSYGHHQHLFARSRNRNRSRSLEDMVVRPVSLESLSSLKNSLKSDGLNKEKILAVLLTSALFISRGDLPMDRLARPILILEDIEGRFHPSLLLSFWSVVENIPVQKIVTTNSGDLISAIPLFSLRRLCRQFYDTRCYMVPDNCFNADDLRRIAFHIRINRPMTLFARCWIFVEGETEIWILNEIAAILGLSLPCEGIRMVEFAQCGLHPLMKLASSLGISFYVLTDGDEAGQRYGQTVSAFVGRRRRDEHLTVLPHLDIEHFLYANGFARVFQDAAGVNAAQRRSLHADKIIELAIHKKSKPGMALAVVNEMQQRGPESVPALFVEMINKILKLAQSEIGLD